jgi:GTPase SAR1 family protein
MEFIPPREFRLCVLGSSSVGKTSLAQRLSGRAFSRKNKHEPTLDAEPVRYLVEAETSAGLLLFHLYDWAWDEKRVELGSINQQLMKGRDGAIFVFDCTDKRTLRDFSEQCDWYQRAAGFDKPWIIVSNKNDQKKKAVQEGEGQAVARHGESRGYASISLADDTGIEDVIVTMARLVLKDVNLTVSRYGAASAAVTEWSSNREIGTASLIGLKIEDLPAVKTHRVLLVVLNSSVVEKFSENFVNSEFILEGVGSAAICESEILTPEDPKSLPVAAIVAPPTTSEGQKTVLRELAAQHNVAFTVSVPRSALESVRAVLPGPVAVSTSAESTTA